MSRLTDGILKRRAFFQPAGQSRSEIELRLRNREK